MNDVYRRKWHRGADGNVRSFVLLRIWPGSWRLQEIDVVWDYERNRLQGFFHSPCAEEQENAFTHRHLSAEKKRGDIATGSHHRTDEKRCWSVRPQWWDDVGNVGPLTRTFANWKRMIKFRLVFDNDTTVHAVHTCTVAFSPSVLIKCSICPYHQTLTCTQWLAQKNGSRHIVAQYFIMVAWRLVA